MSMKLDLIVIDGQNDFLASGSEPWNNVGRGSLYVNNADQEALTVANLIDYAGCKFTKIHSTLDSHHYNDCSHNVAWRRRDGSIPDIFTLVEPEDIRRRDLVPAIPFWMWQGKAIDAVEGAILYTEALAKRGRNKLCLWPVHCEIGTWGQNIYQPIRDAYTRWCQQTSRWIDYWTKGAWQWTEHYSAIEADVPDPTRPETQKNAWFIKAMAATDRAIWTGWAGSHCEKWTAKDAAASFDQPDGSNPFLAKSTFLTDCCAAVGDQPGSTMFKDWREEFLSEVRSRGATLMTAAEFMQTI